MQAAVFEGEGRLVVRDVEPPELRAPDDVLLAVRAAGICGTDVHILAVPPGHPATPGVIMGHEYTADVVATGDRVDHVAPGDRIVVDPSIWCGSCPYCQMGLTNLCDRMTGIGIFRHGGFAPLSVVPARAVYRISSDVASEIAALAEPLADVLNGSANLEWSRVNPPWCLEPARSGCSSPCSCGRPGSGRSWWPRSPTTARRRRATAGPI